MNELLNISNEIPHLNLPNSCIHNSLRHEDNSINSFSSVRAGSVTVTGKKLAGHTNLSPTSLNNHGKLPIPFQTLTRIKKQNNQVKKYLKKTSKNQNCVQTLSPKVKIKHKVEENSDKNKERVGICVKSSGRDESPKSFLRDETWTPKQPLKLKHFSKKEAKGKKDATLSGSKLKKQIEKQLVDDFEKMRRKSKAKVADNKSLTPRGSKIDKKGKEKFEKIEKIYRKDEIFNEFKVSSSHKKLPVDLSKVLTKSRTRPKLSINSESSMLSLNKRNSESVLKHTTKTKSKKKIKKTKKTENIFRDFKKRLTLDSKRSEKIDFPKPPKYRPIQKDPNLSEIRKTLELLKAEHDPDPFPKAFQSEFPKRDSQTNFFHSKTKENSAILIQSHIRKFLARKKFKRVKDSYSIEDDEVKNIITGFKKDSNDAKKNHFMNDFKVFNEGQLDSLQKLKAEEINKIKSVIKGSKENTEVIETITKIINSRYQNIAKIMQSKYENKHGLVNNSGLLYRISEDSEGLEEVDRSEESSDNFKEDKVWSQTTETAANTKDNSVTPSKGETKVLLQNDAWQMDGIKISLNPSPCVQKVVQAESISAISEKILQLFLEEEIQKYLKPRHPPNRLSQATSTPLVSSEPFDYLIESAIDFILKRFEKFNQALSRPLRKNPLEVLAKVQSPYTINPLKWTFTGYPSIFPPDFPEEFNKLMSQSDPQTTRNQIKMLFDCCNEIIQNLRPFGVEGAPMPWSVSKKSSKSVKVDKNTVKEFLTEKIESLSNVAAGKIPDNEFLNEDKLDEDKLHRCREEKIGVLIAQDIKLNEKVWVDYEFEDIQTRVIVADRVLDLMVLEICGILRQ